MSAINHDTAETYNVYKVAKSGNIYAAVRELEHAPGWYSCRQIKSGKFYGPVRQMCPAEMDWTGTVQAVFYYRIESLTLAE